MSYPDGTAEAGALIQARGIREFSVPCDAGAGGYLGVSGIHFNTVFNANHLIGCIPMAEALAGGQGATYLSLIQGPLGSDQPNPIANVASPNSAAWGVPARPNPEVTGYYTPLSVGGPFTAKQNGFSNNEKIQRGENDFKPGTVTAATVWIPTFRTRLMFSALLFSLPGPSQDFCLFEVYRDLNLTDKTTGKFGNGSNSDLFNAQLIHSQAFYTSVNGSNKPCLAVGVPVNLTAGDSLYIVCRNLSGNNMQAVGSFFFV